VPLTTNHKLVFCVNFTVCCGHVNKSVGQNLSIACKAASIGGDAAKRKLCAVDLLKCSRIEPEEMPAPVIVKEAGVTGMQHSNLIESSL